MKAAFWRLFSFKNEMIRSGFAVNVAAIIAIFEMPAVGSYSVSRTQVRTDLVEPVHHRAKSTQH
ncbi:hypothetical protein PQR02_00305 [Paraburkholderia sediminicola]|uniref:Uncharacterized protein n=1 Tax=Paraburkholderia rhynchosiae TaxID=487049 RepID=A0ACC7NDR4_9BURK